MKKIYIIGAITQATKKQLELFDTAECKLELLGFNPYNPYKEIAKLGITDKFEILEHLMPILIQADAVCILPTVAKSFDGQFELQIIKHLQKHKIYLFSELFEV